MIFSVYPNGWYVDISWVGVRLSEAFTRSSYPDDQQPPTTNFHISHHVSLPIFPIFHLAILTVWYIIHSSAGCHP